MQTDGFSVPEPTPYNNLGKLLLLKKKKHNSVKYKMAKHEQLPVVQWLGVFTAQHNNSTQPAPLGEGDNKAFFRVALPWVVKHWITLRFHVYTTFFTEKVKMLPDISTYQYSENKNVPFAFFTWVPKIWDNYPFLTGRASVKYWL